METLEDVLAHFGVKGMKWGVKRTPSQGGAGSEDHNKAEAAKAKVKSGGIKSLSNQELQDFVSRVNLETQYSKIGSNSKGKRVAKVGGKIVGQLLVNVGTQQASKVLTVQSTKLIASLLK